eukprot:Em0023g167a
MAGVRRMSWPWSSLRLRLSASRSEDSSSASSYSPSPSAKERTLVHSHIPLIRNKSLSSHERFEQLVRNLVDWPRAIKHCQENGMTALHFAVLEGDEMCTKALIVFGADINALNHFDQTPLDIALENHQAHSIVPLLLSVGSEKGDVIKSRQSVFPSFSFPSPEEQVQAALMEEAVFRPAVVTTTMSRPATMTSSPCSRLSVITEDSGRGCTVMESVSSSGGFSDLDSLTSVSEQCGHILSLDGGGVRGLIQVEVLSEIERITGKTITEIFDWIIGTSTGAIIALLLVYKKRKLRKLRRTLYRINGSALCQTKARSSEELERLLKEEFGTEMKMSDVKHPKVLISAVSKASTQPKLHFFNNCFGDEFSTQPVWKVARYTSAAPMHYTEFENYVDGGVLANNPCDEGLIKIQSHYRHQGVRTFVSCVVSIGCGVYPMSDTVHPSCGVTRSAVLYLANGMNPGNEHVTLLESNAVAEKCSEWCERHNIPFYRISPSLKGDIPTRETEANKLVDVLVQNKMWLYAQQEELCKLSYALGRHPLFIEAGTMSAAYPEGCRAF